MQRLLLISILLAGPPAPTNTGSPSSDSPPSSLSACLPSSCPPALLPASLPLSSLFPHLDPGPSAGGGQAGGRAGRRAGRRQRPPRGEGEVAAAGSGGGQEPGGRPSWGIGAGGCTSQGTRSRWPGPPTKALHQAPPGHPTLLCLLLPPAPLYSPLPHSLSSPGLSTLPAPFSALRVSQHPSPSTPRPLPIPSMLFPWGLRA